MSSPIKLEIEGKKYVAYLEQSEGENKSLRPKQGEEVFYIKCNSKSIGQYVYSVDGSMPNWYDLGDVFKTRIEAERELVYRQALQRVKEWIYEHDAEGEFKPNKYFRNFTIYFAIEEHKFRLESYNLVKKFSPFGYLKSEAACEQLIKEMDSDLRIIFNV
jgi:hypothetical protein